MCDATISKCGGKAAAQCQILCVVHLHPKDLPRCLTSPASLFQTSDDLMDSKKRLAVFAHAYIEDQGFDQHSRNGKWYWRFATQDASRSHFLLSDRRPLTKDSIEFIPLEG